jgi:NAD(P)-dependent dehydrogenase (short-subunit alcohol dehydrogenase family)
LRRLRLCDKLRAMAKGVALVTGASARIGRALAIGLGRAGWAVAVHHNRSAEGADAVVGAIEDAGGKALAVAADLAREDEVAGLIRAVADALGPVSCLVNNASVFEYDSVETATRESWDGHIAVNLRAPLVLIQAMAGQLPDGVQGNVINMIDQRVWSLTPHFLSYTVSKAGLWTLTQTLALALAPRVRVNAIGPGPTLPSARQSREQFDTQVAATPLRRGATADEIVATALFLLDAPAITGQMIAPDGGQHLGWAHPPDQAGFSE